MDENLARRSHALLAQAVELHPSERAAFLQSACAEDPHLLGQLDRLLEAVQTTDKFLESPALGSPRPSLAARFEPHKSVGGYRIVRVVGVGGMATVYEAIQQEPKRRVALKVLRQELVQESALIRFKYETEILGRIQHPGIVQIFEAGAWDDGSGVSTPYFAMEFVADARTVTAYAKERGLSLRDRLSIFAEVCDAVQHGHQHGVIHRDLKPGNILVDASGHAKVIDFGIARSADPEQTLLTRQTALGQLIGTLNYMSPEQCTGEGNVDIRTDVYALGVILYELVCGRMPHDLSRVPVPEALRRVRDDAPKRPGAIDERLRGDIDAIVMTAMDKEPDRRYPTVAALAADVRRFLKDELIEARPPTLVHQCRLFVRRHRAMVFAFSSLFLAILIGGLGSVYLAYQKTIESQRRLAAEIQAGAERDEARWQAYVANIAGGFAAMQTGEFQHLRTRLKRAEGPLSEWEWRFLAGMAERSERTIQAHDDMVFGFAASPDRTKLASGSRDGTLRVWDAESGAEIAEMTGTPGLPIFSVAFSPDGTTIVSGSEDGTVRLWNAATGEELGVLGRHDDRVESVSFGHSNVVASASADGVARLWNAQTAEMLHALDDQPEGVHGVAFSDDGTLLATWNRNGSIWIRNAAECAGGSRMEFGGAIKGTAWSHDGALFAAGGAEGRAVLWSAWTGEKLHELAMRSNVSTVHSLAFAPVGGLLATGQVHRGIALWSVDDGQRLGVLWGHEESVSGLHFTADGRFLHSASWDRTIRLWAIGEQASSGTVPILRGHEERVIAVAYSPDGGTIASGSVDETIRFWEPELIESFGTLPSRGGGVYALAYSPDGCMLAAGCDDGVVRLWDAVTAELVAELRGHTAPLRTVAFRNDGRRLASGGDDATIRTWNMDSFENLSVMQGHSQRVIQVAYSPDGRSLVSVSRDETVRIWNADDAEPVHVLLGHESDVFAVVYSRDGRRIFSGSRDQSVRVWDAASGECLRVLKGHGQFVTSLSLSPDEKRIAAGSWFGEVVIWDPDKYEVVANFKVHEQAIRGIAFSPDGRWLTTASNDRTLKALDASPVETRRTIRRRSILHRASAEKRIEEHFERLGSLHRVRDAVETDPSLNVDTRRWARTLLLARSLDANNSE